MEHCVALLDTLAERVQFLIASSTDPCFWIFTSFEILSSEAVKHKVETHSLVARQPLPVNSIDVVGASFDLIDLCLVVDW